MATATLTAPSSPWPSSDDQAGPVYHPSALAPGVVLADRYEILELIGKGGMGAVYRARDLELERQVALKIIRPEFADDPQVLRRFKQELILARKVSHKNVIRIFDLGAANGLKFISMDLIEGGDLAAALRRRGKFSPAEAVRIIQQVCRGLEAAHAEGVIHRDLKPQNIMLDADEKVTVMDFGIARSADAVALTRTGAVVGTPAYMSVEQARGQRVDARSDLFALGIIFYELVTGALPFEADSPIATLLKRIEQKPRPPTDLEPSLPRPLNDIIMKCLAAHPADRYQTAQELLWDLETWQATLPGATPLPNHRPLPARRWPLWFAAGLALLLLLAGFLYQRRGERPARAHRSVTLLMADFTNSTADPMLDGTLESLLRPALESASFISVYDPADARRIARQVRVGATALDEGLARLVAVRQGINVVVSGGIAPRKGGYLASIRAMDSVTGNVLATQEISLASKDAILKAAGKLAAPVRKVLGDSTPDSAQLAAAETFTASSLAAAHAYAAGQEHGWKGEWDQAIRSYQRAIELEADFGRAYAGLAAAYANIGLRAEAEKSYRIAMGRLDRMTERERYRTRGGYYLMVKDPRKAVEEFTALVGQFPSDSAGLNDLALAYFYQRDMRRALGEGRRALAIYPNSVLKLINVGLYSMYAGDFEDAIPQLRKVLEKTPTYAKALLAIGMCELARGRTAEAQEAYRTLSGFPGRGPSLSAVGVADLALTQGRAAEAIAALEKSSEAEFAAGRKSAAADHLAVLAEAYLLAHRLPQGIAAADRAVAAGNQESVLFQCARVYIDGGQAAKASPIAAELASRVEPDPRAYAKLIRAELMLRAGQTPQAIDVLHEAQQISNTWLGRFSLGRAYVQAGKFTEASSELESCLKRRGEATAAFLDDLPTWRWLPAVYYYLARSQEGLGSPAAAESYRAFLSMHGSGDDPLVADARRRLAGI